MSAKFKVGTIRVIPDSDGSQTNAIEFADASNDLSTSFRAPGTFTATGAATGGLQYVLPASGGASGTVLTNDGAGNLSWQAALSLFGLNLSIVNFTPYAVTATDEEIRFDNGSAVANLPAFANEGVRRILYLVNASSGTITVNAASGMTIGGQSSLLLTPGARFQISPNS